MKKDDNDMFPPEDNMVDGASRPKVRKKSSNLSNNNANSQEYGTNDENRDIPSIDVPNVPTSNSDDFNNNLAQTSSYDINDEGVSSDASKSHESSEKNSFSESENPDNNSSENDSSNENNDSEDSSSENSNSEDSCCENDDDCCDCEDDCDLNDCYYNNCSSSCKLDLSVLNEISKMCQTAMNNISYLVKSVCNSTMKKELVSMYLQYSNVLFQTNQHFEKYGEVPDCVSIGCKVMGFCGIKMNTFKNKSSSHVADIMIQGTLMGVIRCQKILNCQLNIEQSTTDLLKEFNKFQRDNIDKLNAYL